MAQHKEVTMDKYQIIDTLINKVDALADARGVNRCVITIDIIRNLDTLKNLLKEEEDHAHPDPE